MSENSHKLDWENEAENKIAAVFKGVCQVYDFPCFLMRYVHGIFPVFLYNKSN